MSRPGHTQYGVLHLTTRNGQSVYVAWCACDWRGPTRHDDRQAERDAYHHVTGQPVEHPRRRVTPNADSGGHPR